MRIRIAVEPVNNLQQQRDGLCVALRDAVRGEAQSRRQAGYLRPIVVRPVPAATRGRRRTDDLPQPLSRKALLDGDVGVGDAVLHASKDALQAQRARRRRKGGAPGARRGGVRHAQPGKELRLNKERIPPMRGWTRGFEGLRALLLAASGVTAADDR